MKNKLKKLALAVCVSTIAIIGTVSIQPKEVSAYTTGNTCNVLHNTNEFTNRTFLCASQNYYSVTMNMESSWVATYDSRVNWTAYLQRYTGGKWTTIDTRTGYLSNYSPSQRTFNNIAVKNAQMRIKVDFHENSSYPIATIHTRTFIR